MWFVKDYCGFILAFLTWNLIMYAEFVVIYVLLWSQPWTAFKIINILFFQTTITLAFISHLRSMLTDPGTIKLKLLPYNSNPLKSKGSHNYFYHYSDPDIKKLNKYSDTSLDETKLSLMMEYQEENARYYPIPRQDDQNIQKSLLGHSSNHENYLGHYVKESICHFDSDDSENNTEMIMSSQDGNIEMNMDNGDKALRRKPVFRCLKCFSLKPERAHHCSTCKKCIYKMDHHCPWINNCVGENNQKFFVLFNLYILLSGVHALFLSGHHTYLCLKSEWQECTHSFEPPTAFLLIIFLTFESLLFSIFCSVMTGMQIHRILTDTTAIEALKKHGTPNYGHHPPDGNGDYVINFENIDSFDNRDNFDNYDSSTKVNYSSKRYKTEQLRKMVGGKKKAILFNLSEVFGDKISYNWLSPFHSPVFRARNIFASRQTFQA